MTGLVTGTGAGGALGRKAMEFLGQRGWIAAASDLALVPGVLLPVTGRV
jgi:hypothetical protein